MELIVGDRDYNSWEFIPIDSSIPPNNISPIERRLFHGDILSIQGELLKSPIKTMKQIPGILILDDGKTYGRTENGKRLFYRCIPDNKKLPVFLVPFDLKLGFSKDIKNKYVMFAFNKWTNKHPIGIIKETIGDVSDIENYYEYQLRRRNLDDSISDFSSKTRVLFSNNNEQEIVSTIMNTLNCNISNRLDHRVITIDPVGCVDIDDGLSCYTNDHTGIITVSIYIANVSIWMNHFDLWDYVSRVSTIYLPDKRRTMLPSILSDNLCSLLEKKHRFALCMDVDISPDGNVIGEPRFVNALVCVKTNHSYDSDKLMRDQQYKSAMEITRKINANILDSHDLVEFWMVYMNTACGNHLAKQNTGIFRNVRVKELRDSKFDNPNTQMFFNNFDNISSEYSAAVDSSRHDTLGVEWYTQITSPIRRLVDLVNQTLLLKSMNVFSERSNEFTLKWITNIDRLNLTMKSIKRVQNDCEIMRICYTSPEHYDTGIVFDESIKDGVYKYRVYLENLRSVSYVKCCEKIEIHSRHNFKIFVFVDESDKNNKIRMELLSKYNV
jgi:exoribonuclease R